MSKLEIAIMCLMFGYIIRPYIEVITKILNNAWSEYLKDKHKNQNKDE